MSDPQRGREGTGQHEGVEGSAPDPRVDTSKTHPDFRDPHGGTFDDHDRKGGRQGDQVGERRTAREDAQWGADVRSDPIPPEKEPLPAGLEHRQGPMNKTTGRHRVNPKP